MQSSPDAPREELTIVVPTLNSERSLNWTLASLKAAKEIRVIVADSFSTDSTMDICRRWNVETISVPPGNMYVAINAGLRKAGTEWVGYVNSDDWIFTRAFVKMLKKATEGMSDVAYGGADYVDESGRFLFSMLPSAGPLAVRILRGGYLSFCQPAAIFRRRTFEALNGFDERYRAASDFDFFCRAALQNYSFQRVVRYPVAAFRLHTSQLSFQKPHLDEGEKADMRLRHKLGSSLLDRYAIRLWQLYRLPWFLQRTFRTYELSGRLVLKRSNNPPAFE
ncbi:MAG: glycosyltransferase [Terriglobia bacterium]